MRSIGALLVGFALPLLLASCAAPAGGGEATVDGPLLTSLQVSRSGDQVTFHLQVTNIADAPVQLTFPTGQSADFVVRQGNDQIWRWSDDQMFTQAVRTEVVEPGSSRSYEAQWRPPAALRGEFVAVGALTDTQHRVQQAAQFSLP